MQTLFGGTVDEWGFRLVAPLRLSGWSWSRDTGEEPAENWPLDLSDGARASSVSAGAKPNSAAVAQ